MKVIEMFEEYARINNIKKDSIEYKKAKADFISGWFNALGVTDIELVKQILRNEKTYSE